MNLSKFGASSWGFRFVEADLASVEARIKHMGIISLYEGTALHYEHVSGISSDSWKQAQQLCCLLYFRKPNRVKLYAFCVRLEYGNLPSLQVDSVLTHIFSACTDSPVQSLAV